MGSAPKPPTKAGECVTNSERHYLENWCSPITQRAYVTSYTPFEVEILWFYKISQKQWVSDQKYMSLHPDSITNWLCDLDQSY